MFLNATVILFPPALSFFKKKLMNLILPLHFLAVFCSSYEKLITRTHARTHFLSPKRTWCFVRREKTESSEGESTELKFRGCSAAEKMPTEAELDEFFAAAETNLQRQFIEK